jgi:hypothetical protein
MTTPSQAIHKFCIDCAGSSHEVTDCGGDKCHNGGADRNGFCLFCRYRMGTGRPSVKTIRKICLWCMGESDQMVKECPGNSTKEGVHCELWPYRLARNPARVGKGGPGKRFVSAQDQAQFALSLAG